MAQTNTTKPKRRTYSKELKAYLVEQALTGKRSIASLAQGHGINPNLLQKWIKSVRDEKIAATLSQPLASSNIETNLIDHGSEPAFLPVILQHKTKHEITPQATAFAPTLTGIQLQIPKHNGTPITLSIAQIDTHSLIELLRGLQWYKSTKSGYPRQPWTCEVAATNYSPLSYSITQASAHIVPTYFTTKQAPG